MQNCKSAPLEMGTAVARSVLRQAAVVECSPCLGLGAWGFLPLGAGSLMVLVVLENLQICLCGPSFVSHHIPCSVLHPVPSSIRCHPPSHAILHPMPCSITSCIPCHPASCSTLHSIPSFIPSHPPSHATLHPMPSSLPSSILHHPPCHAILHPVPSSILHCQPGAQHPSPSLSPAGSRGRESRGGREVCCPLPPRG